MLRFASHPQRYTRINQLHIFFLPQSVPRFNPLGFLHDQVLKFIYTHLHTQLPNLTLPNLATRKPNLELARTWSRVVVVSPNLYSLAFPRHAQTYQKNYKATSTRPLEPSPVHPWPWAWPELFSDRVSPCSGWGRRLGLHRFFKHA